MIISYSYVLIHMFYFSSVDIYYSFLCALLSFSGALIAADVYAAFYFVNGGCIRDG